MSILNTSVSGMQGNSNWLSSISQNVANANTTGYKNVETDFSSLGRSDRQRQRGFRRRLHKPGLAQRAPGQRRLHFDADRPRRPGRRVFRRVRLQRHALSDAQRLLHARRLRQPRQQRRLLPDGGERAERRFAARRELADRPSEGQRRQRRPNRDGDHDRLADRQSCRPPRRRSPPPICRPPIQQARPIPRRRRLSCTTISAARTRSIFITPTPGPTPGRSTRSMRQKRRAAAVFPIRQARSRRRPSPSIRRPARCPPARRFRLRCRTGRR